MLPDITTSLNSLVGLRLLEGPCEDPLARRGAAILGQLGDTLTSSETSLSTTSDSWAPWNEPGAVADRPDRLQNSATVKDLAEYLKADPEKIGAFMAAPVPWTRNWCTP